MFHDGKDANWRRGLRGSGRRPGCYADGQPATYLYLTGKATQRPDKVRGRLTLDSRPGWLLKSLPVNLPQFHFTVPFPFCMNKPLPFALALLLAGTASANHLTVANVRTAPAVAPYAGLGIVADVQWENSWRDNTNWNVAWLFVKFRPRAGGVWRHATLGTADAAYGVPAGAALSAATDGKSAFVYRAAPGGGPFAAPAAS